MYIVNVSIYLSIYLYLSLIFLSKYMAYYVMIIGHVWQYIKLTERHFSEKHVYIKKSMSVCVFVL